ncbi:MAG: DUF4340 domain-containing protein [Longimicrobiales bacterium]
MSEKGLKALIGLVAVLCTMWATVTFLPRGGGTPGAPPEALSSFFAGVTPEAVSTVRFQSPGDGDRLVLTRRGPDWTINGFRADSGTVAGFWDALGAAEVGDLVGSNPGNHPRLGVSPDSAWALEVEMAEGARTVLIGKSGTRYGTAYVRLPAQDEVYLLDGGLRPAVTRTLDDWRNKRVARVDTSRVQRIQLERDDTRMTLAGRTRSGPWKTGPRQIPAPSGACSGRWPVWMRPGSTPRKIPSLSWPGRFERWTNRGEPSSSWRWGPEMGIGGSGWKGIRSSTRSLPGERAEFFRRRELCGREGSRRASPVVEPP